MPSLSLAQTLMKEVERLYEAYPYPRYPLLAKPRWQEGYLASSLFAARLAGAETADFGTEVKSGAHGRVDVLVGGAGEILPYVIRRWEPRRHRVTCLDLSRQSLRRARFRLFPIVSPTAFVRGDLAAFLAAEPGKFQHIDAYGVIHHMPNPRAALKALACGLAPGGTARLMFYNAPARTWIWDLARACHAIGFDPFARRDLADLRRLLTVLASASPALGARLSQLGPTTIANDARLVDTFLHPREARLGIKDWLSALKNAGLDVIGLFDRYAELDDLPNPLWAMPSAAALAARAADRRFENNLELFVRKPGQSPRSVASRMTGQKLVLPPRAWFSYDETRQIPWATRFRLWHAHLRFLGEGTSIGQAPWLRGISGAALARLARVGAILPGMLGDAGRERALAAPLAKHVEAPKAAASTNLAASDVLSAVVAMLAARGRDTPRRRRTIMARLNRAQSQSSVT